MTGFADGESNASIRTKINSVLVTEFESMAELLADTAMTYTASQPDTVAFGRSIVTRKEGFRFEVRPVVATDNTSTTAGGVLIKALPDATGAYNWVQLGGNGNGVADNLPVVANIEKIWPILSTDQQSGKINVPDGTYYFSNMFVFPRSIHLCGTSGGLVEFSPWASSGVVFEFAAGVHGLRFVHGVGDAIGPGVSSHCIVENIALKARGKSGFTHGIFATARFTLMNVSVTGFSGDGIHINSTAPISGNANLFCIFRCKSRLNGRHGLYCEGADANAGQIMDFDANQNAGWGIYDSSFLGNHYFGIHTDLNGHGPVRTDSPNAPNLFAGLYTEANQGPCVFARPTQTLGGAIATGAVAPGNQITTSNRLAVGQQIGNLSAVYHVSLTNAGSGYTSTPTVTIAAPTGQVQATATAVVHDGRIRLINLVNRGQGYTVPPTVTITDASGSGATATAVVKPVGNQEPSIPAGSVAVILLDDEGSGYVNPTITISAPNTLTATAQAVVNTATGQLERIIVTNPGAGYHDTPTVTITGGGGTGATATAVVGGTGRWGVTQEIELGGSLDGSDILRITRNGLPGEPVSRLRYVTGTAGSAGMSNDLVWNENNLGAADLFRIRGSKTTFTGGRRTSQGLVMDFVRGIVLNGLRNMSMSTTVPPTSGEYARGDIIWQVNANPAASPGVVCTTTGLAGSTAVFKAMGNLEA